jgi:hypothetical protein
MNYPPTRMTTPQKISMKKEKKTLDSIEFTVLQTKMTSFHLDYQAFIENNIKEYPEHIETTEEWEKRCATIWKIVCSKTGKYDEIALDEADGDDDVDEDYVCDASHDFIDDIVDEYNKTCPKFKAFKEYEKKKLEEEKKERERFVMMLAEETREKKWNEEQEAKQKKIAELTAELEKLRSS